MPTCMERDWRVGPSLWQILGVMDLVMPAVLGGELFQLLEEYGAMEESDVQFYSACLVRALQHLHGFGIVYRDLKAENVLLSGGFTHSSAGWPVLVDFGLANFNKADGSSMTTFCGTPSYIHKVTPTPD